MHMSVEISDQYTVDNQPTYFLPLRPSRKYEKQGPGECRLRLALQGRNRAVQKYRSPKESQGDRRPTRDRRDAVSKPRPGGSAKRHTGRPGPRPSSSEYLTPSRSLRRPPKNHVTPIEIRCRYVVFVRHLPEFLYRIFIGRFPFRLHFFPGRRSKSHKKQRYVRYWISAGPGDVISGDFVPADFFFFLPR